MNHEDRFVRVEEVDNLQKPPSDASALNEPFVFLDSVRVH
jgi:hypothetical protein